MQSLLINIVTKKNVLRYLQKNSLHNWSSYGSPLSLCFLFHVAKVQVQICPTSFDRVFSSTVFATRLQNSSK